MSQLNPIQKIDPRLDDIKFSQECMTYTVLRFRDNITRPPSPLSQEVGVVDVHQCHGHDCDELIDVSLRYCSKCSEIHANV